MSNHSKLKKFWLNKKVLIIGHTGFKGSWLSILLKHLGSKVFGYSLAPKKKNLLFKSLNIEKLIDKNFFSDINNTASLKKFILNNRPEIIINLAAQSLVKESYLKPIETYRTNLMGALNILNICKNIKNIRSILMITTDKVYKNKDKNISYKENDQLGGNDPYSSSKAASEIAIESFRKSFFSKPRMAYIATARAGNIIGGGDWSNGRLIPDIFKSYFKKKVLNLRYPNAIRPWQHVLEPIYGYLILSQKLYEKKSFALGSWNFGPNYNNFINVKELVKRISDSLDYKIKFRVIKIKNFYETNILKLNSNKAKNLLKWRPILSQKEMITFTNDWYINLRTKNVNLYKLTVLQIETFLKKI
jgi:CDP-glucose 4,6-dehydratase